jgi:basic amino acid/polyamine antiporter, APA family
VASDNRGLGLWSGVGLVIANTIGVGVLTNTGYMAGQLSAREILLAWLIGGVKALAGAYSYAAIAAAIPRSGGEYRYLSDLWHPFLGSLAGWTSLLVGFAAPVALAASTIEPFFATLWPGVPPLLVSVSVIAAATASQAFDLRWSRGVQNGFAVLKAALLAAFIIAGFAVGSHAIPSWRAPGATGGFPVRPFAVSLVYIAFAFSGWNTAIYAAEEFRDPRRTVPRAMIIGTLIVTGVYLAVNWIFVANLSGPRLVGWLKEDTSRITLAHLLIAELAGAGVARLVSLFVVLALVSSVISMTMVGPRVSAAMAREGFLPRSLAGRSDRPPMGSVLLQSALALLLLTTHGFEELLRSVGSILTVTSALTVAGLLRLRVAPRGENRPSWWVLGAGLLYLAGSCWILWFTLAESPRTLIWLAVVTVTAAVAFTASHRRGPNASGSTPGRP